MVATQDLDDRGIVVAAQTGASAGEVVLLAGRSGLRAESLGARQSFGE